MLGCILATHSSGPGGGMGASWPSLAASRTLRVYTRSPLSLRYIIRCMALSPSPVCPRTQSNQTRADECRCSCRPISPHTRFPVRTFTTMQSSIETAGLLPLPNAAHCYSSNRGLCYHVATPPIDPYDSLRYIQALENEVGSAALKYGGSELHRHAPTLQPKQQQQQKWNGGRPYVPGGPVPHCASRSRSSALSAPSRASKKRQQIPPASRLHVVAAQAGNRTADIKRGCGPLAATALRTAASHGTQRISHAGISRSSTASFVTAPSNGGTRRAEGSPCARRHQGEEL